MTQFSPEYLDDLAKSIKAWAKSLGFQQVGITDTDVSQHNHALKSWVEQGYHGDMAFFEQNHELRTDPAKLEQGTLRVISVRMNYLPPDASFAQDLKNDSTGYISRYALGRDYHKLIRKRLKQLGDKIREHCEQIQFRPFVDSAPILEHALAEKAGIGWTGKHSLTLNKDAGSWFFLGELFINIPLPVDQPVEENCGACTACMTICPTQAIVAPYTVDARKCISYLTIEHKGPIPLELRPLIGNRIYGCDDCQLICPWNRFADVTDESDFLPRSLLKSQPLTELFAWDEETFLQNTTGTPIRRIGYQKWKRNLAVAMGNARYSTEILQALREALPLQSELVQEHIIWALAQQESKSRLIETTSNANDVERLKSRLVRSVEKGLPRDA
ncbi:tRNA epoxyqueuosine(34) reductase QueG [Aliiglaciecola sp. M165]|uniref:tRNA epoxyqueuosine(34) reductase QueG n=1 Tax=Aliiglaciecola sp. M165 TaxID=2593649 RepID=UPI001180C951|nr:tRNA epoxyqueuosine(34) reductase QueG [Aliiglaciecola sp. M165]TRY33814.1 tRNA epoxyqueuosine(34) reductase QueG [Aliiglaciecola sp. M165]